MTTGRDVTIIYHDNCHDGITALWAVKQALPDATPFAGKYGHDLTLEELESFRDRHLVLVDFCYKPKVLAELARTAKSVLILDHHKSAVEEYREAARASGNGLMLVPPWSWGNHLNQVAFDAEQEGMMPLVYALFDMERSGAGIAWDFFHPGEPRPALINYVEDRDLWRFSLTDSKEVHAACNSYPMTLEARHTLVWHRPVTRLAEEGRAILRYHEKLVAGACEKAIIKTFLGHDVPVIAVPTIELVSDIGNKLCKGYKFAAMTCEMPNGDLVVSLRSDKDGLDVSALAKAMGGGGHKNAAGYTIYQGSVLR